MSVPKNPRRIVLADLRNAKEVISYWISEWDQRQTVPQVFLHEDGRRNHRWVARQPHEKIENDADAWSDLEHTAESMVTKFTALANYARQQRERAEQGSA